MLEKRHVAAGLAVLSLAFPAGALAQGAGDNQYEDPFAEEGQGGAGGQGGNGDMDSLSGNAPGTNAKASARSGELARTGAEPGVVALLGAGLLLTGAGLRIRVRRPVG
jgi:hypothetical protein